MPRIVPSKMSEHQLERGATFMDGNLSFMCRQPTILCLSVHEMHHIVPSETPMRRVFII